jgi:hypothetical protein
MRWWVMDQLLVRWWDTASVGRAAKSMTSRRCGGCSNGDS